MLAILELPDKTAHKGLSCFSSNKVASKQHQRRHQWRPPSRRLARTRDRWLAPYHGTTAACGCRGAPPLRLRARVPARPPGRTGAMESILSIGVQTTQTTRLLNATRARESQLTRLSRQHGPHRIRLHCTSTPAQSDTSPRA
jgi:hypothetical protein